MAREPLVQDRAPGGQQGRARAASALTLARVFRKAVGAGGRQGPAELPAAPGLLLEDLGRILTHDTNQDPEGGGNRLFRTGQHCDTLEITGAQEHWRNLPFLPMTVESQRPTWSLP